MNCRAKWAAQFAFKANNPNERLPLKDEEGKKYDKALFKTPYTDNDCGQQKWGGWNIEGQKEFLKIRKEIKQAKKAKTEVQEGEETKEVNKFEQVEEDYMKMLIQADNIAQVNTQRPPAARAPNERDTFDPNPDDSSDDEEDDDDDAKGAGKAKGNKNGGEGEDDDGNGDDDEDDDADDKGGGKGGGKKGATKRQSSRNKGGSAAKKSKTK